MLGEEAAEDGKSTRWRTSGNADGFSCSTGNGTPELSTSIPRGVHRAISTFLNVAKGGREMPTCNTRWCTANTPGCLPPYCATCSDAVTGHSIDVVRAGNNG